MSETSPFKIHSLPKFGETIDATDTELLISKKRIVVRLGEQAIIFSRKKGYKYLKPLPRGAWEGVSQQPSEQFGHTEPNGDIRFFKFSGCSIEAGVYLIDELRDGHPNAAERHSHSDVGELNILVPNEKGMHYRAHIEDKPAWRLDASNIWVSPNSSHRLGLVSGSGIHFVGHFPIKSDVSSDSSPPPVEMKLATSSDLPE